MRLPFLSVLFVLTIAAAPAQTVEENVRAATPFKDFKLEQIAGGDIRQSRQGSATVPAVQAVQTCFLIHAPMEKVAATLLHWNPAGIPGLDVSFHHELSTPVTPAAFAPALGPFFANGKGGAWLVAQSKKPDKSELMVSEAEQKALTAATTPEALVTAWAHLLAARADAMDDFVKLIDAVRRVGPIDIAAPGGGTRYWELSDVSGRGSISEGLTWRDGARVADGEFFVTSEYKASFDVSTLWPATVDGKPATVVWRIDSALSPQFEDLHGTERLAASGLILASVKQAIAALRTQAEK